MLAGRRVNIVLLHPGELVDGETTLRGERARHVHDVDGTARERIVLSDWRESGHALEAGPGGLSETTLQAN